MLDERVTRFVKDAVRIRSREFEQDLGVRLVQVDSAAVMAGQVNGTGRISGYAQACRQDLRSRAQYTFLEIQRALGLYPQLFDETLKGNLLGLLITEVRSQCTGIQRMLTGRLGNPQGDILGRAIGALCTQLNDECEHLNEKYKLEMEAFTQAATLRSAKVSHEGSDVVIHGSVGVVQTGAYATATLTMNVGADEREAVAKALDVAAAVFADSHQLTLEHQRQMLEVVDHLREAVRQARPNQSLIRGLFSVLCTTLQTLAACEPAMAALRAAALPFGIAL
jgi:hypothetical protein